MFGGHSLNSFEVNQSQLFREGGGAPKAPRSEWVK